MIDLRQTGMAKHIPGGKAKADRSLSLLFVGFFSTLCLCAIFYSRLDLYYQGERISRLATLFFFDRFFLEALCVSLLGCLLLQLKLGWRILFYTILFVCSSITLLQVYTLYLGGEYLTRLAVENINHISLLLNTRTVSTATVTIFAYLALVYLLETRCHNRLSKLRFFLLFSCLVISILLFARSTLWLPGTVQTGRDYISKVNYLEYDSPLSSFYTTFMAHEKVSTNKQRRGLTATELLFLKKEGYTVNMKDAFPLMKDHFYLGPLAIGDVERKQQPNIIIFFTEGFSGNLTNIYNDDLPALTPNLLDFSKESMRVDNYYGHTWATYRGLLGQLCSIYPHYGGYGGWHTYYDSIVKPSYNSLNKVLSSEGYHTVFLDTHIHDKAYIDEMMGHIGFDEILTGDVLSSRYLANENPLGGDSISDLQFYRSLIGNLQDRETTNSKPFFMGIYTLGTHAFRDIAADGSKYGDGSNRVLNRVVSLDKAFGEFWHYFKQSSLAENTIIIFTSDHASYMEKAYLDAMAEVTSVKAKQSFWDTIPLVIYDPTRELPNSYDAKVRTSVDFTPSLLHYLGVANRSNSFVGESIFETEANRKRTYGVVCADHLMIIDKEGEFHNSKYPKQLASTIKLFDKYTRTVKHFEINRQIWPAENAQ